MGENQLDGGVSDDRKLVNVSIDLINDDAQGEDLLVEGEDLHGNVFYQGGQWYEVK